MFPAQPAQIAAMRAELHRRSIAQMKVCDTSYLECFLPLFSMYVGVLQQNLTSVQINNRFIQDMYIFGDPSRIPIVIVERVMNAPRRTFSENSYFRNVDVIDKLGSQTGCSFEAGKKPCGPSQPQKGRELKIVVFVHGFQASLLFMASLLDL